MHVSDRVLDLRQVGPNHVVARVPVDLPPGPAEIVVIVDGREHVSSVFLVEGMSRLSDRVKIVATSPGDGDNLRREWIPSSDIG